MDHVDKIAKLITEDPDILNEGWEELGIEDPGFEGEETDSNERLDVGETLFGKNVSPDNYLIRIGENSWTLIPMTSDIGEVLTNGYYREQSMSDLFDLGLQRMDVSVVTDPGEWSVQWVNGWDVTEETLLSMGILNI